MAGGLPQSGVALVAQGAGAFLADMGRASKAVVGFGNDTNRVAGGVSGAGQIMIGALREVGALATQALAAAGRAAASFVTGAISTAGDFEQTLNVLGATSGATSAELAAVGARAKELGADMTLPATSAQDAAEVMLELSKAGFTVQEAMDAAKGSLQLSAAAQVDAATAAQITAGAINAFGLAASDAGRVADLLAGGANASSASMTDLAQGLQQGGFAFDMTGQRVEDLVTSLAALTNVGLTGSDAGTALKNAMMRLMNPTKKAAGLMRDLGIDAYDAQGNMKPWPELLDHIRDATAGMTNEQRDAALGTIFLSDGMKAMIPLLDMTAEEYAALEANVTKAGSAEAVAAAQMQGWNGATAAMQSQLETLQLVIGQQLIPLLAPLGFRIAEIIGTITSLTERFVALIPEITGSAEPVRKLIAALTVLVPAMGGPLGLALRLYEALLPLAAAFSGAGTAAGGIATVLTTLLRPLGATSSSVVTGTVALLDIWAALGQVADALLGPFAGGVGGAQGALAGLVNVILSTVLPAVATAAEWLAGNLPGALATLSSFLFGTAIPALAAVAGWFATNLPVAIALAQSTFAELGAFVGTIMPSIQGIITSALTIIQAFWQQHGDSVMTIVRGAMQAVAGIIQVVFGVIQGLLAIFAAAMTGDYTTMMDQIQQANTTIWTGIKNFLSGILEIIAGFFGTSLDGIVATWTSNFEKLKQIAETLMGQAQTAITGALGAIGGAFGGITSAIGDAIDAVKRFISAASKIKVPSLVTPGSPTPLEIGLRGVADGAAAATDAVKDLFAEAAGAAGIGDALSDLVGQVNGTTKKKSRRDDGPKETALADAIDPAISAYQDAIRRLVISLGGTPTGTPAQQLPAGVQGGNSTTMGATYNMPIYTNQSPAVLQQSMAVMEAMSI